MTRITLQNGLVVMHNGSVGTESECCCGCAPCPNMQALCISVTLTDYAGDVHQGDQNDFFWIGGVGFLSLANFEYTVIVSCNVDGNSGGITVTVGWGGFLEECGGQCTSGVGSATISCSAAPNWYAGTASGVINFENVCDPGCPENLGSFSVAFSDEPC